MAVCDFTRECVCVGVSVCVCVVTADILASDWTVPYANATDPDANETGANESHVVLWRIYAEI